MMLASLESQITGGGGYHPGKEQIKGKWLQ